MAAVAAGGAAGGVAMCGGRLCTVSSSAAEPVVPPKPVVPSKLEMQTSEQLGQYHALYDAEGVSASDGDVDDELSISGSGEEGDVEIDGEGY